MINRRQLRLALGCGPGRPGPWRGLYGYSVRRGGYPMVMRRSEIPSLHRVVTRTLPYVSKTDRFGSEVKGTLETKARCRRLDLTAKDQLSYSDGQTLDRPVRRYLVRPAKGSVDYLYDEGGANEETRSLSLTWTTGNTFDDDGMAWTVRGIGHFDSAGKMLELLVRGATI